MTDARLAFPARRLLRHAATALLGVAILSCRGDSPVGPATAGPPAALTVLSGAAQSGEVGTELAQPLAVRVVDAAGLPVSGQLVNFVVLAGGGHMFAGSGLTDANGVVQDRWTLGTDSRASQRVEARAVKASTGAAIVFAAFTATAHTGPATTVTKTAGDLQSATAGTAATDSLAILVADRYGNPVAGAPVAWATTGGTIAGAATTDTAGRARARWTLGAAAGSDTATATVGTLAPVTFTATGTPGAAASVTLTAGAASAAAGTALPGGVAVHVKDASGNGVPGVSINWTTTGGTPAPASSTTDVTGNATTAWTLGTVARTDTLVATVAGTAGARITATVVPGPAAALRKVGGDDQTGSILLALADSVSVRVTDQYGNPVAGGTVTFTPSNGGTASPATVSANTAGLAATRWTLGAAAGQQSLSVSTAGAPGISFTATATSSVNAASLVIVSGNYQVNATPKPLVVRVLDANGAAIAGAAVRWTVTNGGGSIPAVTVSDANGLASAAWTLATEWALNTATATVGALPPATFYMRASDDRFCAAQASYADGFSGTPTLPAGSVVPHPIVYRATDRYGNPAAGPVFNVRNTPVPSTGTVAPASVQVDSTGSSPTFFWTLSSTTGPQTLGYTGYTCDPTSAPNTPGRAISQYYSLGATAVATPTRIAKSGDAQTGTAGQPLPAALRVTIYDAADNPTPGVTVRWSTSDGSLSSASTITDAQGQATVTWRLGATSGTQAATATAGSLSASFTATAVDPAAVRTLVSVSGDGQTGAAGAALAAAPTVRVVDGSGAPVAGVVVTWTPSAGSATPATSTTVADGSASTAWTLGPSAGPQTLLASIPGGSSVRFAATAQAAGQRLASLGADAGPACVVKTGGALVCWGSNLGGQLATGGKDALPHAPTVVAGGIAFRSVVSGQGSPGVPSQAFRCGLATAGGVYCWGGGTAQFSLSLTPTLMPGTSSLVSITAGADHLCGLTADGSAWCWGANNHGQLGTADIVRSATPRAVVGGLRFTTLKAGAYFTCGIATDGITYCWGANDQTQLGIGVAYSATTQCGVSCEYVPTAQPGPRFVALDVGSVGGCGLTAAGALYCWGRVDGLAGAPWIQCTSAGGGTVWGCALQPTAVPGTESMVSLSIGSADGCGLTADGRALCWGSALNTGYTGVNTERRPPVEMASSLRFIALEQNGEATCGITTTDTVQCWGGNRNGELGQGTSSTGAATPALVPIP